MKPVGWRNESYRHALAARGIPTKLADPEPAFVNVRPKRTMDGGWTDDLFSEEWYWFNEPDYDYGYDRFILHIDTEIEDGKLVGIDGIGEVSEMPDGRGWMAAPDIPIGPVEVFDTVEEAKAFVINYYSPQVIE